MSDALDPYRDWLRISNPRRPPNHYQLLGLRTFEADEEKIASAAMAQMATALEHDPGPHAALARKLFDELEQARNCLSDPKSKAAYDVTLLREQVLTEPAAAKAAASQAASPADASHPLESADHEQMLVVAENLSDSQAVLLRSRLATLKSKRSDAPSTASYRGPKPTSPHPEPVSRKKSDLEWRRLTVVGVAASAIVLMVWWSIDRLLREPPLPDPVAIQVSKLADPDAKVRLAAVRELGKMGPRMNDAVPQLVETLEKDTSDEVRYAAAQALSLAGPSLPAVAPQLNLLADKEQNPAVRRMIKSLTQGGDVP